MQFAQIINTPRLGQVVLVDDVGTVDTHHPGFIDLYLASEEGICKTQINRLDLALSGAIAEAAASSKPEALESILLILHRKGGSSFVDRVASANHPPFAKLFHSERFGQILAIRDGEMEDTSSHIAVRFRPTRPAHMSMSSVLTPSDKLRQEHPDMDDQELMAHQFANMQLHHAERCIESYLRTAERLNYVPAVTFS
jgi:hypothetical protein